MQRIPVKSDQVFAVGYDSEQRLLEVQFISRAGGQRNPGSVYRYRGVAPDVHAALMTAQSIGKHFGAHVKDKYPTTKVDPETGAETPVALARASSASIGYLRALAQAAGLWGGTGLERMGPAWRQVVHATGRPDPGDVLVETWLGQLLQPEASAAIEFLKKQALPE